MPGETKRWIATAVIGRTRRPERNAAASVCRSASVSLASWSVMTQATERNERCDAPRWARPTLGPETRCAVRTMFRQLTRNRDRRHHAENGAHVGFGDRDANRPGRWNTAHPFPMRCGHARECGVRLESV